MNKKRREGPAGVGDAAVHARTGKTWQEWFQVLDAADAARMGHTKIARYLKEEHGVSGWWAQMVAVGYEQACGMRERHQAPTGYQVSVSKTVSAPVGTVYQAWTDEQARDRWLPGESINIRKATPERSIRITWTDRQTGVDVDLYDKGPSRSRVVVQHTRLRDLSGAEQMKSYWKDALERLKDLLVAQDRQRLGS